MVGAGSRDALSLEASRGQPGGRLSLQGSAGPQVTGLLQALQDPWPKAHW